MPAQSTPDRRLHKHAAAPARSRQTRSDAAQRSESIQVFFEGPMSTPRKAADILIDTLLEWGIDTVFGLPGDGINGIVEALRTRQSRIRFIVVRHEENAAFMACAHAK